MDISEIAGRIWIDLKEAVFSRGLIFHSDTPCNRLADSLLDGSFVERVSVFIDIDNDVAVLRNPCRNRDRSPYL